MLHPEFSTLTNNYVLSVNVCNSMLSPLQYKHYQSQLRFHHRPAKNLEPAPRLLW